MLPKGRGPAKGKINPLSRKAGCYVIKHKKSGCIYVGSTINIPARITSNLSTLRNGKHKNKNLQALYKESPNVTVYVRVVDSIIDAQKLEQHIVTSYKDSGLLCNIAVQDVLLTRKGALLTKEHKDILLESSLGQKRSKATRKRMSDSHKGITLTATHKRKLSKLHKKRLSTEEGKAAHARGINKLKHPVVCEGLEYESKSEAARILNVNTTTIMYRIKSKSKKFRNYYMSN